jgi:glycosyltransferase involved in cell wall biosynthesis
MKKKTKLLFCINSLETKGGGAEKVLSAVINYLVNQNFDVKLITFDSSKNKFFYNFSKKIDIYTLGHLNFFKNPYLLHLNRIVFLMVLLFKIKPEVSFGFMHSIYVNLAFASIFSKTKIVACEHILPTHFLDKKMEFFLINLASIFIDRITVVSEQVKNSFVGLLKKKMIVINNVVNTSEYKKKPKSKREKIILSVGRFVEQKNFIVLINAFHKFQIKNKDWKLLIVGDGIQKQKILSLIKYLGIKKYVKVVNFTRKLRKYYKKSSIYVCTSIYESFGLTVAEALVHRLPCIAFKKCSGVNKIITNNKNGLLISGNFDDYNYLSEVLDQLVNNKKKLKKMENYYDPRF